MRDLPYLPEGREILYVGADNEFMSAAKEAAEELSSDHAHQTGVVIVRHGVVVGRGANVSTYHEDHGCRRKELNIPTGENYELCEGCDPKNHAEQVALSQMQGGCENADIYLWGHWWCCESCWSKMIEAGIQNVYLVEDAEGRFKK
jgi:dCMP deaminase